MITVSRVSHFLLAVSLGIAATGCGSSAMTSSPTGSSPAGATLQGTVVTGATAAASGVPHAMSGASGIRVSVTGTNLSSMTDGAGKFVITGVPSGTVELSLKGQGVDARLTITGLAVGQTLTITVRASGSQATLEGDDDEDDDEGEVEFTGAIQSINPGAGTLVVAGRNVFTNGQTRIRGDHDKPLTLADLKVGQKVEVEGMAQANGVLARKIDLEEGDDDD